MARASLGRAAPLLAAAALALGASPIWSCSRPVRPATSGADLGSVRRWWIVIGHAPGLESVDWRHAAHDAQMVVLAPDPSIHLDTLPAATIRLGYLSVGEIGAAGGALPGPATRAKAAPIEPNPDWPGNTRVDIRDQRWQEALLRDEAPRLLAMGFHGFMLDTIDTAPYLEGKDPARFAGSRRALREWVGRLRRQFPHAVVVANGTDALADVAPFVDGYVVEGVFATYDFGRRAYRRTTDDERRWKLAQIARARAVAARPVFTIEYADVGDVELGSWAEAQSAGHGFRPYVTVKDINMIP
jgi:endo-alpha-1,4-polygalactosaminidase (GH114 family)